MGIGHRGEGIFQILARERLPVARTAGIEPTSVGEPSLRVKEEEIRCAGRSIGSGHLLLLVIEYRKRQT